MLQFFTSLSFLYLLAIALLMIYGLVYYRDFTKSGRHRKWFPFVFGITGIACFAFLYINIHAPLSLGTFSNLDHHFIRHDGFRVSRSIELGRSDTVNFPGNAFNRFVLEKKNNQVTVAAAYSEEPFYAGDGAYKILSVAYPATGHAIRFRADTLSVQLAAATDTSFELTVNGQQVSGSSQLIRKASPAWNLFRNDTAFISSPYYTNESLVNSLKQVFLLRDDVSRTHSGALKYFLSGRLFRYAGEVAYDNRLLRVNDLAFKAVVPDQQMIAWGIGFLDNNRNQWRLNSMGNDSFALQNRYPVSYPFTEEHNTDFSKHSVDKFLVSDPRDLQNMPAVFSEGFLFAAFPGDSTIDFNPTLLSFRKDAGGKPLQLKTRLLQGNSSEAAFVNNRLILPAKSSGFSWVFSVNNSFNWGFGSRTMQAGNWQLWIFGSLGLFFLLVFFNGVLQPSYKLGWVWQVLSIITLVLLTTRFFLYWRYKSFPPYEGLDLPSQQQLNSFSNFGIIVAATVLLAFIFGAGLLKRLYNVVVKKSRSLLHQPYDIPARENWLNNERLEQLSRRIPFVQKKGAGFVFLGAWILVLIIGAAITAFSHFDPSVCRHLAMGLLLIYFVFVFISYRFSPLSVPAEKSWWSIRTGRATDIIVSNPVKVLLSLSLLGLFAFIDIGFAIVFLNFLLFNEAFLCTNYAIAGLSTGSRRNARLFGIIGGAYLLAFILNLIYAPYIFNYLLGLPGLLYGVGYALFGILIAYVLVRLLYRWPARKRVLTGMAAAVALFTLAFLFFPKERILDKAAMTRYRIDVMTMPADKAIEVAYQDGKTYEPVIRAAQNQWFINTFIDARNNPYVNKPGFHLLPHAPQNKGVRYNAQATDLVASRFLIAEHGNWSVLLYVLLLLLPTVLLASFYKLYPDFTNRINNNYPVFITGFSLLNYLLITALLVILAATGRYIFFGQDLPFGSILSKQSIVFPVIIIIIAVLLFKHIPLQQYPNRKKLVPGFIVFAGLALLLFFVKPVYNTGKEFAVTGVARDMDNYIELRLQPVLDYFDTSAKTKRRPLFVKDRLFTDSLMKMMAAGMLDDAGKFFNREIQAYTRNGFSRHLDQARLLYLDLYSGRPQLAVNENYFRVEPPPHLQQSWTGNVFGDTSDYIVNCWNAATGSLAGKRISGYTNQPTQSLDEDLQLVFAKNTGADLYEGLCLVNKGTTSLQLLVNDKKQQLAANDSLQLPNPSRIVIKGANDKNRVLTVEPDAFMRNYYVNGSRFYVYPKGKDFTWARNFAESISMAYTEKGNRNRNAFVSLNATLMDSLTARIEKTIGVDTSYKQGAEYGICIADGNGRLIVMNDLIKGLNRPDPNDKAGYNKVIIGDNGFVSQSLLRKQVGNINLLRLNPGPGSTLKPIVFSAIASQLKMDWDAFAAEGFSTPQHFFGGEKVAEYDFEKNNGRIASVADYLKYSDNYYHSNVLLLGSYSKQGLQQLLAKYFVTNNPQAQFQWPYFSYKDKQYWLNGYANWPGYFEGKADFGSDSSFVSLGLINNYGIYTYSPGRSFERFNSAYDSTLFEDGYRKSGFILPENALFDQKGAHVDHRIPYDVFMSSFRGHVKGSSQVMIPPVKMLDAFGRMASQNRHYSLTLNPYAPAPAFAPFDTDSSVGYANYLSIVRDNVFKGLKEALFSGTAARLGGMLKNGAPYYYYAKTGTTGDNDAKTKSKLFAIIISERDINDPDFNFRNNKFYTIYFTSQNGPPKQNEEFQAAVIKCVQESAVFKKYMNGK